MSRTRISFIGIGGQKCASTWIYDILDGHPEVCLSRKKELNFFSNFWDRGYDWYSGQFDNTLAKNAKTIGEVSPLYLSDGDAPIRAAEYNPYMKIIVTFRNPIERAFSNHKHNIRQGFVSGTDLSFEAAMVNNPTYVEFGYYGKHLSNWLQYFPWGQIHVLFFEDIVAQPFETARSVYRFLEIADDFTSPAIGQKSNESVAVANVELAQIIDRIRNAVKSSSFPWVWDGLRFLGIRAVYRNFNLRDIDEAVPKMLPQTRSRLAEVYEQDIGLLEKITGRNLYSWKAAQ